MWRYTVVENYVLFLILNLDAVEVRVWIKVDQIGSVMWPEDLFSNDKFKYLVCEPWNKILVSFEGAP